MSIAPILAHMILSRNDDDKPSSSGPSGAAKVITETIEKKVPVVDEDTKKLLREDLETRDRANISLKEYMRLKEELSSLKESNDAYKNLLHGFLHRIYDVAGVSRAEMDAALEKLFEGRYSLSCFHDAVGLRTNIILSIRD